MERTHQILAGASGPQAGSSKETQDEGKKWNKEEAHGFKISGEEILCAQPQL